MFRMGFWELVLIFAVVLLIFGGKRLPSIATGLGEAIRNFKKSMNDEIQNPSQSQLKNPQTKEINAAENGVKTPHES